MDLIEVRKSVTELLEAMKSLTITTPEGFQAAGAFLKKIKGTAAVITDHFEADRERTFAAYKAVLGERDALLKPLADAEATTKKQMAAYQEEAERKARLEAKRLEDERRKAEEARLLNEAEKTGDLSILDETVDTGAVHIETANVDGVQFVEKWDFEVTDAAAVPREYMAVNLSLIAKQVSELKGSCRIPGVRVYATKQVRAGKC